MKIFNVQVLLHYCRYKFSVHYVRASVTICSSRNFFVSIGISLNSMHSSLAIKVIFSKWNAIRLIFTNETQFISFKNVDKLIPVVNNTIRKRFSDEKLISLHHYHPIRCLLTSQLLERISFQQYTNTCRLTIFSALKDWRILQRENSKLIRF